MVKMTSVQLLNVIAKVQGLECLAGDVGNAYLNAETKEKMYMKCSLEFGPEMVRWIPTVEKGLYGLKSSENYWHLHLPRLDIKWGSSHHDMPQMSGICFMRMENIATYVDDFLITARDVWSYMTQLQSIYSTKKPPHPNIYLGALYTG